MRTWSLAAVIGALAALTPVTHAETIGEVLHRSHQMRLQELTDVSHDSAAARQLHVHFERLVAFAGLDAPVELRVVRGGTVAETLHGYVIVVHEELASRPEGEQLFVIAHELGHVAQSHWTRIGRLYEKWVPGVVAQRRPTQWPETWGAKPSCWLTRTSSKPTLSPTRRCARSVIRRGRSRCS